MSMRLLAAAPALFAAALVTGRADATSCIGHAYEKMDLKLMGVAHDRKAAPVPRELGELTELINSGDHGASVLLWNRATMRLAKFYSLDATIPPTPRVASYISSVSMRSMMTACGYPIRYTPILPGRYVFQEEHSNGSKTSADIDEPVLTISAGRSSVELTFKLGGDAYTATYAVTCASFEWEDEDKGKCAPQQYGQPPVAAPPKPEPDAGAVEDPPPQRPPDVSIEVVPPSSRAHGCAGCTTAQGRLDGWSALGVVLLSAALWARLTAPRPGG